MTEAFRTYFEALVSMASLIHLIVLGLLTAAALWQRSRRNVRRFCLVALAVAVLAALLPSIGADNVRSGIAEAIWIFGIVGVYTTVLALLVAKARSHRAIAATSAALLLLTPFSIFLGLRIMCVVGHNCA